MTALVRDRSSAWLGGVCAGISRRYGIDVSLVRFAFVVFAAAGGLGFAAYALGWLVIPAGAAASARRRIPTGRAAVEVALGTGLLLLSVLLTFRELGLWFSDALVWPLVLVASGGALIWRQSGERPTPAESPHAHPLVAPAAGEAAPSPGAVREARRRAAAAISRTGGSGSRS